MEDMKANVSELLKGIDRLLSCYNTKIFIEFEKITKM